MKTITTILFILLSSYWSFAQVCGTPYPQNPRTYSGTETASARSGGTVFCIDVFFHIVRNTNGTNAFSMPNTDAIVRELNQYYTSHNIIINNAGSDFIDNSNYVNIDNASEARLLGQVRNHSNAINYYIVRALWGTPLSYVAGTANTVPSNNLVIRRDKILSSISPHELGHCLDLYHTHRGTSLWERDNTTCIEAQDGSNSDSCGDKIRDTPADPGLSTSINRNVDGNCRYTGGGGGYDPLTDNIMSYAFGCHNSFTPGQGERMRMAIASHSTLNGITSNGCVRISSIDNLCSGATATVSLIDRGNTTTAWSSSPNVHIISDSDTQAIISVQGYSSGTGWVSATLTNGTANDTVLTDSFQVYGYSPLRISVTKDYPSCTISASVNRDPGGSTQWYLNEELKTPTNRNPSFSYSSNTGSLIAVQTNRCGDKVTDTLYFSFPALYTINGPSSLCSGNDQTFRLQDIPSCLRSNIRWTVSSNVQIIPQSDNSQVTISALSSGNGWVRASLSNGDTLTKRISVQAYSPLTVSVSRNNPCSISASTAGGPGGSTQWYLNNNSQPIATTNGNTSFFYSSNTGSLIAVQTNRCGNEVADTLYFSFPALYSDTTQAQVNEHRGNITITTQSQVDALCTILAGKTRIDGNLTIGYTSGSSQSNITNLTPLSNITHITGNLRIQQNKHLININKFNNLQTIGGDFWVKHNFHLTRFGDFSALQTIGGDFLARNNINLTALGDFSALQTIGGDFWVRGNSRLTTLGDFPLLQTIGGDFWVRGNSRLTTLGDFPLLQTIVGDFLVGYNINLTALGDFSALQSIGGYFSVFSNDTLTTLGDFSALQTIGGDFWVKYNNILTTLGDFPALQAIERKFEVEGNPDISTLGEFSILQTIGENFRILHNNRLTTLGDFPLLQTIGGDFGLGSNAKLPTLDTFPNLQTIGGDFSVINNDTLTTLGYFSNLQTIGGKFGVGNNAKLPTLGDFSTLQTIGGLFRVNGNDTLTSLGNFPDLQSIGEFFRINNNKILTSLGNFPALTSIGTGNNVYVYSLGGNRDNVSIFVENNPRLSDCHVLTEFFSGGTHAVIGGIYINNNSTGCNSQDDITTYHGDITVTTQAEVNALRTTLSGKTRIEGNLMIGYNDNSNSRTHIIDLTPLRNITHITRNLTIRQNGQLVNINALTNLQTIGGYFYVYRNNQLITLDFPILGSIGVDFNVNTNDRLTALYFPELQTIGRLFYVHGNDLTALDFSSLTSIGVRNSVYIPSLGGHRTNVSIVLENNPRLSDCHVLTEFLSDGSHAVRGRIYINTNAAGCNSQSDITTYRGDITVSTQAAVDALSTTLLGKTRIIGNLTIGYTSGSSRSNITDLSPLHNITHITGNLTIRQNGQLVNINALTNLQTIGGYFYVYRNNQLITLDFPILGSIGVDFNVNTNDRLTALYFPELQTIGRLFYVHGNDLTALDFSSLTSIGVRNSVYIPSLGGHRTNVSIVLENNPRLSDCHVLTEFLSDGSHAVRGRIYINTNAAGCNSQSDITTYRGDITVSTQAAVDALSTTLLGKTRIIGNLTIGYTSGSSRSNITDLSPLHNITHITGNLTIRQNGQLVNINALTNLQTIGGYFYVYRNNQLITLDFPILGSIGVDFNVNTNDRLTALYFPELQTIGRLFYVHGNDLTALDFSSLTSIGVRNSVYIPSLGGHRTNVSIVLENNIRLSDCHVLTEFLSGGSHAVSGEIYINNNAPGCNSQSDIQNYSSSRIGTYDVVTSIVTIAESDSTSFGVSASNSFTLYPNPTERTLTIEGVTGYLQMYIHDLVGREVMTYSLTSSKKTIDVSDLPSGMYVVTLQGEDKTWTEVLIKK